MALSDIIKFSPKLGYGQFSTLVTSEISDQVDIIKQILLDAGWEQSDSVQATGSLSFPLGFPVARGAGGGGLDVTNRIAAFYTPPKGPTLTFQFWDITAGDSDPTSGHVVGVLIGSTTIATFGALSTAMSRGIWIISAVNDPAHPTLGPIGMNFESLLPGTAGNNYYLDGNGTASTGTGLTKGGGWVMRSSSQQLYDISAGNSPVSLNTTRTTLTIRNGAPRQDGLQVHVAIDGMSAFDFYAQMAAPWKLWANPFTARFDSTAYPYHAGDVYVGNAILWCGSVSVAPEVPLTPVGFLWFNHGVVDTLGAGNAFAEADTAAATKTHNGGFAENECSIVYYHYTVAGGGVPLTTRMGKSVLMPALVSMPVHPPEGGSDESRVVGYMWDAFVETDYHLAGTLAVQEGQPYFAAASQFGDVQGTLWLRSPVKPPDTGVTEPPAQTDFVGTCNLLSDALLGNTFGGAVVNRLTGTAFTSDLEGRVIYIDAQPYRVATVKSSDFLVLAVDVPANKGNVAYHT